MIWNEGLTRLHRAAAFNREDVAALVAAGEDVNARTNGGLTPPGDLGPIWPYGPDIIRFHVLRPRPATAEHRRTHSRGCLRSPHFLRIPDGHETTVAVLRRT